MPQKKRSPKRQSAGVEKSLSPLRVTRLPGETGHKKRLDVVLKCDSFGSCEALVSIIKKLSTPGVDLNVIHSSVGPISKTDLLMALTGSKLLLGFNVGVMPKLEPWLKDHGVEVRLYNVIYKLTEDLKEIARSFVTPAEPEEAIIGKGQIIALFKSSHKGIILGCEIKEGMFRAGRDFRVISAMGTVYTGKIESLQVERTSVKEATVGQQVGIKIEGFSRAKIGDLVECYQVTPMKKINGWEPSGSIVHLETGMNS